MNNAHELTILIVAIVTGAVGVNVAAQLLKKIFKLKVDSVIHTMVVAISFVASAAQYAVTFKSQFPPEILGISASAIYGLSQLIFKYAKYAGTFLGKVSVAVDATAPKTQIVVTPTTTKPEAIEPFSL